MVSILAYYCEGREFKPWSGHSIFYFFPPKMISFLQYIIFERISYSEWPLAAKFRTNYLIQAVINDYLYRNFFPLIVSSLSKTKLMYEG